MTEQKDRLGVGLLGWREWVELPELGIAWIKAKVDTGARTSALHAFALEVVEESGIRRVRFDVHPIQRDSSTVVSCVADVVDRREVSDSGGHREQRWVIETPVTVAGRTFPIELTLTDRDTMLFRMLLGRTALKGRFQVDPARSYVCGKPVQVDGG